MVMWKELGGGGHMLFQDESTALEFA